MVEMFHDGYITLNGIESWRWTDKGRQWVVDRWRESPVHVTLQEAAFRYTYILNTIWLKYGWEIHEAYDNKYAGGFVNGDFNLKLHHGYGVWPEAEPPLSPLHLEAGWPMWWRQWLKKQGKARLSRKP
jgi:hypothetical protein